MKVRPFKVSYLCIVIIRIIVCLHTKHAIVLYLFNLHFYPFLSTILVGRNSNKCSYAIESHDQKYCITQCILINVIEVLELKTNNHLTAPIII